MNRRTMKKLTLNKETLRNLQHSELSQVVGGAYDGPEPRGNTNTNCVYGTNRLCAACEVAQAVDGPVICDPPYRRVVAEVEPGPVVVMTTPC